MVVKRGQVWWANLGEPNGSESGFHRPILIVQDDAFNRDFLLKLAGRVRGQSLGDVETGLRFILGL